MEWSNISQWVNIYRPPLPYQYMSKSSTTSLHCDLNNLYIHCKERYMQQMAELRNDDNTKMFEIREIQPGKGCEPSHSHVWFRDNKLTRNILYKIHVVLERVLCMYYRREEYIQMSVITFSVIQPLAAKMGFPLVILGTIQKQMLYVDGNRVASTEVILSNGERKTISHTWARDTMLGVWVKQIAVVISRFRMLRPLLLIWKKSYGQILSRDIIRLIAEYL